MRAIRSAGGGGASPGSSGRGASRSGAAAERVAAGTGARGAGTDAVTGPGTGERGARLQPAMVKAAAKLKAAKKRDRSLMLRRMLPKRRF
jgi:hypothetical protein